MTLHLVILNSICHFLHHSVIDCRSFSILDIPPSNLPTTFASSANFHILFLISSSMSFMYILNKIGRSTDPCGTPLTMSCQSDSSPFRTPLCLLPFNHS